MRFPFAAEWPLTNDFAGHLSYSTAPGLDFGLPLGTPVLAAADGTVSNVDWSERGGNYVMVRHAGRRETLYSHLSEALVVKGQRVKAGEVLGLSGQTGHATGPHLHFAVKRQGKWIDPWPLIQDGIRMS